jgi:hypothetical protein
MRTEVYLLSLPLARHRTIVPRRRDPASPTSSLYVRPLELRVHGAAEGTLDASPNAGTLQRIDTR